jgi:hypothetical protein
VGVEGEGEGESWWWKGDDDGWATNWNMLMKACV